VNEQVLLLLPLIGKPLQAKYCGPYRVKERLGPVDYRVSTPDRRKVERVVHVNLMKRYNARMHEKMDLCIDDDAAQVLIVQGETPVKPVTIEDALMKCGP
jgi:hypothetical protein